MVLWHLRERVEKGHVPKKEVYWSLISQGNSDWPGVFQKQNNKRMQGNRETVSI